MYERRTAGIEGDFVVFLIGMRVNRWRDVRAWFPVARAMPRMIEELQERPELGLLGSHGGWMFGGPAYVQYWRSYAHLEAYARNPEQDHLPAWRAFYRAARTRGARPRQLAAAKKANPKAADEEGTSKKEDPDPQGLELLKVEKPLDEATKYLTPLLELSPKNIDGQIAGFEVYIRRSKCSFTPNS